MTHPLRLQPVDKDLQLLLLILIREAVGGIVCRVDTQPLPVLGQKSGMPARMKTSNRKVVFEQFSLLCTGIESFEEELPDPNPGTGVLLYLKVGGARQPRYLRRARANNHQNVGRHQRFSHPPPRTSTVDTIIKQKRRRTFPRISLAWAGAFLYPTVGEATL